MFEEFRNLKDKLEALYEVQGVIFRICDNQIQYIISFDDFKAFNGISQILPQGWSMDFIGDLNLALIYYHLTDEEIEQETEKIMFP